MDADENSDLLEQQLKILGQKIRLDILKKVSISIAPLSYSALQREVIGENSNSTNFAFHLKLLKKNNLIDQTEDGYDITALGKKILKSLISIEQILNEQNKSIMIRTSKYATEPFNLQKIESYLINEGKMEVYHAKQIANEVSERLSKTNIEYLTTPLMREYINGILLENGLEEVRHRLTRLGTPPSEAMRLFNNNKITPKEFLMKLGSAASEQFLLLNLLPKQLADLYLSSEIILLNLNTWSLKPLAFYSDSQELIKLSTGHNLNENYNKRFLYHLINKFFKTISQLQNFFSQDILIGNFNKLINLICQEPSNFLFDILISEVKKTCNLFPQISLEFSDSNSEFEVLRAFLKSFKHSDNIPNIVLNYLDLHSDAFSCIVKQFEFSEFLPYILFNYRNHNTLLNSITVDIKKSNNIKSQNKKMVILDKILINLHAIALNSNKNDDTFEATLMERLINCFDLFDLKQELIIKKLKSQIEWSNMISRQDLQNSIKAISFFGLNEAVEFHCGIELDRTKTSENFAIKILDLMCRIIQEGVSETSNNYLLTQPHQGTYLKDTLENMKINFRNVPLSSYSPCLTRKDEKFPLDKQIIIFNKLRNYIYGGNLFYLPKEAILESIDLLNNSKMNFKCF